MNQDNEKLKAIKTEYIKKIIAVVEDNISIEGYGGEGFDGDYAVLDKDNFRKELQPILVNLLSTLYTEETAKVKGEAVQTITTSNQGKLQEFTNWLEERGLFMRGEVQLLLEQFIKEKESEGNEIK